MNPSRAFLFTLALASALPFAVNARAAADQPSAARTAPAVSPSVDKAAWLAKAKAAYPLDTCVVSGDKLEGDMDEPPVDYIYQQPGQPDRLVRFCCKNCIKDFKRDPEKYLKKIDAAAAAKHKAAGSS